ncbi:MAG: FAD-binding protein [Actinobacteria bacterium]|nr:FAD-binding protein [Actinomycetota bacterium]
MTRLADDLGRALPTGRASSDPEVLESYRRDNSALTEAGHPAAVVLARTSDDIQATLAFASGRGIPVVTRGAGSGLSGGANAVDECIVLVTTGMDSIIDIDTTGLYAAVEPGVINSVLRQRADTIGLFYPPDPASADFSTLGGNIATNAGGLCCAKYGVTRDYVMALDLALADGTIAQVGTYTRKSSAGYDIPRLIVGSEGTLAVITSATLRLIPKPAAPSTVIATFASLDAVGPLPALLASSGVTPAMLEVLDQATIVAIEERYRMGLDRSLGALIVSQTDGQDGAQQAARIAQIARELAASEVHHTDDHVEGDMLLAPRKLAYPALEQSGRAALLDDVAVPLAAVPALFNRIHSIGEKHAVDVATFGHLGDGNLHPTILYNRSDADEVRRVSAAFDAIIEAALDLDGTVTGEHGVGILKAPHLGDQLDNANRQLHADIKHAFDPLGLLNPGKALPTPSTSVPS